MDLIKKMRKNKKGFTLVELIVVLVILAILAAIAIPTFNGYIKDAREKTVSTEARTVLLASDSLIAQANETGVATIRTADATGEQAATEVTKEDIADMAGVDVAKITELKADSDGELSELEYKSNDITYEYVPADHKMVKKETK